MKDIGDDYCYYGFNMNLNTAILGVLVSSWLGKLLLSVPLVASSVAAGKGHLIS